MCDLWGTLKSRERTCSPAGSPECRKEGPQVSVGPWDQDGPPIVPGSWPMIAM